MPGLILNSRIWPQDHLLWAKELYRDVDLLGMELKNGHSGLVLPHGGTVYYGSTQPKKHHDAKTILTVINADIEIRDLLEILHWYLAADEKSKTFIGNAYEKADLILTRIYEGLGYEKVIASMVKHGVDPDKVGILVNDCGAYFNTDYSKEPEFERCFDERGFGPWPGVEFAPVTDAQGGLVRFFAALDVMRRRKEKAGEQVDLTGYDHQTYLFFKLAPRREDITFFSFEAATPIKFVTNPAPFDAAVLTSYHFTEANDPLVPSRYNGKTRAEYEADYLKYYGPESKALREFIQHAKIPQRSLQRRESFNSRAPVKMSFSYGSQHDVPDRAQSDVYEQFTLEHDAIILGPHDKSIADDWENNFIDLFDLWCHLIMNKQVRVEEFEGTPFIVLNRKNPFTWQGRQNGALNWNDPAAQRDFIRFLSDIDPAKDPWLKFMLFTQYLHENGFVKQEPRFLYTHFEPDDQALLSFLHNEITGNSPKKIIEPYAVEEFGRQVHDRFRFTVLGSATTRVPKFMKDAIDLGFWGASRGFDVRTGGGRYGIMGGTADGVFNYMASRPSSLRAHFSAIHMPRTMQFEGCSIKLTELHKEIKERRWTNKYLCVEPDFDRRIRNLVLSDAIVAHGAAGMGTYGEIAKFLRWKKEDQPFVRGKQMIVINPEHPDGRKGIRLMDPFLAILPKPLHRHLNVVPDTYGAKTETLKIYDRHMNSPTEYRPSLYI
ncbi:MAG: hypothetical protein DYH13_04800 [Alphaproteobacteria bacterium PRO2]|nr:hypothetical protein [Alphaproteobacteria bacterium PRO2]